MSPPRRARAKVAQITEAQWAYLNDEPLPADARRWDKFELDFNCTLGRIDEPLTERLWAEFGPQVLERWAKERPGTRPRCWWRFSAPGEPRHRVAGGGVSYAERWPAAMGVLERGMPRHWAEIDPVDPPTFEAEASYLDRHGLLSAAERRRLPAGAFLPEILELTDDDAE